MSETLIRTGTIKGISVAVATVGLWSRDRSLLRQGVLAILTSTMLALAAGAVVAWLEGGPIRFNGFKGP